MNNGINQLIYDLKDFSLSQQLDAICDGTLLANYDVTEEEIENLYNDLALLIEE
jgi:hypothetical protein